MGIGSVVAGLQDGGVKSVYNFPGFHSHEIAEELGMLQISLNERAAYASAYGASLAGNRTVVTFKNVGMNVASDAFLHSIIGGVNAGLVVVVTDDITVVGSQESQDSRHYFDFYGGFWYEPESAQDAYDFCRGAFSLSEQLDVPVVLRLTGSFFDSASNFKRSTPKEDEARSYVKNPEKYVVHPYYFKQQEARLSEKHKQIDEYAKSKHALSPKKTSNGVIVFGSANSENTGDDTLTVKTLPLPSVQILDFVRSHDRIKIVEEGNGYVYEKIGALTGETSLERASQAERGVKTKFVKWDSYEVIFKEIHTFLHDKPVTGDITQFTVETTDTIDVALSLGVAVSTAIGIAEAMGESYAIVGDTSFLHEGRGIVDEAVVRRLNLGIIIIDNGVSWCTGGQTPAGSIDSVMNEVVSRSVDCTELSDMTGLRQALREFRFASGVRILRIRVPVGSLVRRA